MVQYILNSTAQGKYCKAIGVCWVFFVYVPHSSRMNKRINLESGTWPVSKATCQPNRSWLFKSGKKTNNQRPGVLCRIMDLVCFHLQKLIFWLKENLTFKYFNLTFFKSSFVIFSKNTLRVSLSYLIQLYVFVQFIWKKFVYCTFT